jgi:hypothetical protein
MFGFQSTGCVDSVCKCQVSAYVSLRTTASDSPNIERRRLGCAWKTSTTGELGGRTRTDSGSSFQILIFLSASAVMRLPDLSNVFAKIPASESREPGCTMVSCCWKRYPVRWSQNDMLPLSAPDTKTPSALHAIVLTTAECPERFWMNLASGRYHCLMLSGDAEVNVFLIKHKWVKISGLHQGDHEKGGST